MTKTYGIDVSHWQGAIEWPTIAPYIFWCIMKATDGWYEYTDPQFPTNKAGCIANNIPWGAYHYYQPAFDPIDQADDFVNYVGDGCAVYVVDVEEDYGSGDDFSELLKEFLDRVEMLTDRKPTIYTSPGFWNAYLVPTPAWTDNYPLWVAHWGVVEPTLPHGWTSYVIHQWGEDGIVPGINAEVDENWFNGDLNAVWDFFEFEIAPPPAKVTIRIVSSYKRAVPIFAAPDGNTVQGYALPYKNWRASAKETGTDGQEYYRVGPTAYINALMANEIEG